MKLTIILLLSFLCFSSAYAEISTIACPSVQQLQFRPLGKDRYEVSGKSDVLTGSMPNFILMGTTKASAAKGFSWNHFVRSNSENKSVFTCAYEVHSENSMNDYFEIKAVNAPWVKWCYIENDAEEKCHDHRMACLLKCEML